MTETTSILGITPNRRVYAPPDVARPGVMTFMAQATLGYMFGCFLVLMGQVLPSQNPVNLNPYGAFFLVTLLQFFALMGGLPVGLALWLFNKLSDQPMSRTFRSTIAVMLLAIGYFGLLLLTQGTFHYEKPFFLLQAIFIPGITIGLLAGSRLRPWRELVRGGEARGLFPRILAGLSGFVLRVIVVYMLLAVAISIIPMLQQFYYRYHFEAPWALVAFGHFVLAAIALFARTRFEVLAVVTAIANAPLIASLWMYPSIPMEVRYWLVGYLIAWAIFLLTRWRQTDVALAVLRKEFRYYLID